MGSAAGVRAEIRKLGDPERARLLQRFFKTGPGEYGEGDVFLGLRVPQVRALVKKHRSLPFRSIEVLLRSRFHEERLFALLVMVERYRRQEEHREKIYRLYLKSTDRINNWDLVDVTAGHIVGAHLFDRDRSPLYRLCLSSSLWERRISVISTFHFIDKGEFGDSLALAELLLRDREDLIHKASGWVLREVGKRDLGALESFLVKHCRTMPRTMLRYSIEKLPQGKRRRYLEGRP
jgi:3-methyladenine DNA glycosylase AlkD